MFYVYYIKNTHIQAGLGGIATKQFRAVGTTHVKMVEFVKMTRMVIFASALLAT